MLKSICKPKGPSFDPVAGDEEEVASVQGKLFLLMLCYFCTIIIRLSFFPFL